MKYLKGCDVRILAIIFTPLLSFQVSAQARSDGDFGFTEPYQPSPTQREQSLVREATAPQLWKNNPDRIRFIKGGGDSTQRSYNQLRRHNDNQHYQNTTADNLTSGVSGKLQTDGSETKYRMAGKTITCTRTQGQTYCR